MIVSSAAIAAPFILNASGSVIASEKKKKVIDCDLVVLGAGGSGRDRRRKILEQSLMNGIYYY